MKTNQLAFLGGILIISASSISYSQVEVQGTGNTSATSTFITKNSDNTSTMVVRDDGNVGIGTTNPGQMLEVNGVIAVSGVQFPDATTLYSANISVSYSRVYTVAGTGGDFTSIQTAIGACAGASSSNPYLVRVMPGIYIEPQINCQPFVDLRGSGKHSCFIQGTVYGANNCVIENFNIDQGIVCSGTSPFILHNIITRRDGNMSVGIDITAPGKPWIKENDIINCTGYGIICNGFGADAWIIANKILQNGAGLEGVGGGGGIRIMDASPTISNNLIDFNHYYGIYVMGSSEYTPAEPTIDDNVIGNTSRTSQGIGISISIYTEPRIIYNDIYLNGIGIEIDPPSQPSILSNNINYNEEIGIKCFSNGLTKRVVIQGNHIHSNTGTSPNTSAGVYISNCNPMITHNNISQNRRTGSAYPDIDYSSCSSSYPMISMNVYDNISKSSSMTATGLYNATSGGTSINP